MASSAILLKESVGAKYNEIATKRKQEFACIGATAIGTPVGTSLQAHRVRSDRS